MKSTFAALALRFAHYAFVRRLTVRSATALIGTTCPDPGLKRR